MTVRFETSALDLVAGFHARFGPPSSFLTTLTGCSSPSPVTCFGHTRPWGCRSLLPAGAGHGGRGCRGWRGGWAVRCVDVPVEPSIVRSSGHLVQGGAGRTPCFRDRRGGAFRTVRAGAGLASVSVARPTPTEAGEGRSFRCSGSPLQRSVRVRGPGLHEGPASGSPRTQVVSYHRVRDAEASFRQVAVPRRANPPQRPGRSEDRRGLRESTTHQGCFRRIIDRGAPVRACRGRRPSGSGPRGEPRFPAALPPGPSLDGPTGHDFRLVLRWARGERPRVLVRSPGSGCRLRGLVLSDRKSVV